ncbi:MAG: S41 family peptidase [Bacteroidales bacterium]
MKRMKYITLAVTSLLLTGSCEKIAMHPQPGTDNLSIFEEYVGLVTTKYALSEVKGVDLEALADSIRPFITPELSPEELYDYMNIITVRMREGHTNLKAEAIGKVPAFGGYPWYEGYPISNSNILTQKYYFGEEANPDVQLISPEDSYFEIQYGYLPQDPEIGYIVLTTFSLSPTNQELETMMEYLKNAKGIIIEIRGNFGGYIEFGARLVSFFTDEEYGFATNYIKNGPGPDDYAATDMKITPSGSPNTFTKPVMILHDRISFSTGSIFPVMMSPLAHVTTLGQITGGGTGEIIEGYLANGWQYTLSTSNLVDAQGNPTDNGREPDIPVVYNPEDTASDAIIERAILEIQAVAK